MKRKDFRSFFWAVLLAMTAVAGSIGCMVSGFSIEKVAVWELLGSWLLAAVVFGVCFSYRAGLYPLVGVALLGGYLWHKGPLNLSMELLVCKISRFYNNGYGWGVIRWSDGDLTQITATTALCWIGLLIVICVVWAVVSRRGTVLAVLTAFLPLVSCMVLTDTVPGSVWLYLLLLPVILLLMTHSVRQREEAAGNRLTALLLLPTALALLLLFLLIPRDRYEGQAGAQKLEDWVTGLFSQAEQPELPSLEITLPDISSGRTQQTVSLRSVGPKEKSQTAVMTVTAAKSGTLYLRGKAYDTYDGTTWAVTEEAEELSLWPGGSQILSVGEVKISTVKIHDVLYMPYYPSDTLWYASISGGFVENGEDVQTYTVNQAELLALPGGSSQPMDAWLALPEDTRAWAEPLARAIIGERSGEEAAQTIVSYVKNSASYDLGTARMSPMEWDFARWFLEESDTGYCVHFATAATVLLRAAGIPARYVTGYMLTGQAGQPMTVAEHQSHAWVEYCLPGGVWQVLEPTPSSSDPEESQPEQTEPEETLPLETEAIPQPTRPSQSQTPTATEPSDRPQEPQKPVDEDRSFPQWPLWLGAAVALLVIQWRLRLFLRRLGRSKGETNERALACWQEVEALCRHLQKQPEKALLELAQKAKFSQHTITSEELKEFSVALQVLRAELKSRPLPYQLYYTLILALY